MSKSYADFLDETLRGLDDVDDTPAPASRMTRAPVEEVTIRTYEMPDYTQAEKVAASLAYLGRGGVAAILGAEKTAGAAPTSTKLSPEDRQRLIQTLREGGVK